MSVSGAGSICEQLLTYGEARGRGPDGASGGVTDDGFVDVARADEAVEGLIRARSICLVVYTSGRCMLRPPC